MKKLLKLVSAAAIASTMVSVTSISAQDVSLSINYYDGAISDTVIENAKAHFSDWELNFSEVPADNTYDTKLRTSLNSNSAPDISAINSNIQDFLPYYERFVNLAEYGSTDNADQFVEWKWSSTFAEDGQYQIAMPIDIGPTALQYNVANFEAAGLPTDPEEVSNTIVTYEDYMAAAKQMKEEADLPMWQSINGLFDELARGMSKRVFTEDGELTMADGELREIWDYVIEAHNNGYILNVEANTAEGVNSVQAGLFGASTLASWGIADLMENGVKPEEWLIAKAPGNPSNYGGSYLAVIGTTDFPAEAAELVIFLTNEEAQTINYDERALFPSIQTLFTDEFFTQKHELFGDHTYNQYFAQSAEDLVYIPEHAKEKTALSYFTDQLILVAQQGKDSEAAWEEAVANTEVLASQP